MRRRRRRALAEPFAIPRRPRTVPEPEGAAEGEGEGEGEGDGGDAPEEAAAAEGEGEGEGEEAAAPTPPVEEPDDPDTTFYADLPLTLATRDLLHRGVRFEMCKVETVPRPPAEESKETNGDAGRGRTNPRVSPRRSRRRVPRHNRSSWSASPSSASPRSGSGRSSPAA